MFKSFVTLLVRNFLRQKFYSFINVIGLTCGLVCALLIYLWVNSEWSMNKFHQDEDRLFRIYSNLKMGEGDIITWTNTPGPLGESIADNLPEVEHVVRIMNNGDHLFQVDQKSFVEPGRYADSGFFKLFNIKILYGSDHAPSNRSSVAISSSLAKKLFGDENAIGKAVRVKRKYDLTVEAVFEDVTEQSSLKFEYLLPFELYKEHRGDGFNWGNYDNDLYIKITKLSNAEDVTKKINDLKKALPIDRAEGIGEFHLQPMGEFYLYSRFENGVPVGGRIDYVRIIVIVGLFILVMACINFINLATARATTRAREVGIKKVAGAQRLLLIFQFLGESVLISALAMAIAIGIAFLLLPVFNTITQKSISLDFTNLNLIMLIVTLTLIIGIVSGIYPAFFLSAYKPISVLKGNLDRGNSYVLRNSLVIIQFVLTVTSMVSAIVVFQQLVYIETKNLGFNRESVLEVQMHGDLYARFELFKAHALRNPDVEFVSRSSTSPVNVRNRTNSFEWPGKPAESSIFFRTTVVDYDYLELLKIPLVEGRYFSRSDSDSGNVIITKRTLEVMGIKEPIGLPVTHWEIKGKIVGVVEDFHGNNMQEEIAPFVFLCNPSNTYSMFIRYNGGKTKEVLAYLEEIHKKLNPEYPFTYTFLDEQFNRLYLTEKTTSSLAVGFTLVAIIISGLGLFGLAAYTAERRRKELGIRKTLGATVSSLIVLLTGHFGRLCLIASIIGFATSYFLMNRFLQQYAYHVELSWIVFATVSAFAFLFVLGTVGYQVAKASLVNPAEILRNE
jgi:putative ABC transport system permease protein